MISKELKCESRSPSQLQKLCQKSLWMASKYCQQSCYEAGFGYEGDLCLSASTLAPTPVPTPMPSAEPTPCSNEATPWMISNELKCASRSPAQLEKLCQKSSWMASKYCQQSCYEAGFGYEGDLC
jgi:hypothetical protein